MTSIKPRGWLKRQLRIQADGVTGKIDEFWDDLDSNSGWLGGGGEDWERGPYYMDGLVPLAFLLDDPRLIAKAEKWVGWTLANQRSDGSIGPEKNDAWWARMIMLKVLIQYYQATGDRRVIPLVSKYAAYHLKNADKRPLHEWAKFRWGDEVLSLLWLYNRTGDEKLLDLARLMHRQGFDWRAQFDDFKFTEKMTAEKLELNKELSNNNELALSVHGVNNGMALKTEAVWSQLSGEDGDRTSSLKMLGLLDKYHGLPNGIFSGDEHLAGTDPSQGVETCAVVETMFSLEQLVSVLGEPALADRLEKIAFNALPGAFTADMSAHQYDQQPNQIRSDRAPRQWSTNGDESNVFGFEPWFGCCTANQHQGFPKFAASLWMATDDDGIAAIAYAPSEVRTFIKNKVPVSIVEETEYPFRPDIKLTVNPQKAIDFPLVLHIPAWAAGAEIKVNGHSQKGIKTNDFYRIKRKWKAGDVVEINLPLETRTSSWFNDSIAIERGPLIFSLRIGEDKKITKAKMNNPAPPEAADYEILPTSAWNFGIVLSDGGIEKSVEVVNKKIGEFPFSAEGAPVELRVKARRVLQWKEVMNSAGAPPKSPVKTDEKTETVTLIPYGAAKLRITAFPFILDQ
ncbi:MAG: glycoside hydrolase family 127 protein [Pyrinomonadaceae bacterium]